MFSENNKSGKHLICDIKNISNLELLHDVDAVTNILEEICQKYDYSILNKASHCFQPQGFTILYLLSESHLSVHTFPEKNYIAFDLYTCRDYSDNSVYHEIYDLLIEKFSATRDKPIIIDRCFSTHFTVFH